jgi:hypothetical protein
MLPRHISDAEVPDFVGAMLAAQEVASNVKAANVERAKGDDRSLATRGVMVTPGGEDGGPPDGYTRLPYEPSGGRTRQPQGTIGRRKRRGKFVQNSPPGTSAPDPVFVRRRGK